jgi:hypothetical protein
MNLGGDGFGGDRAQGPLGFTVVIHVNGEKVNETDI